MHLKHKMFLLFSSLIVSTAFAASKGDHEKQRDRWEKGNFTQWRQRPEENFTQGAATFEAVKKTLLQSYIDAGLTEDDLYRAAVQGMLNNLNPDMSAWNRLMTPTEYAELLADADGKIVGVGVEIGFNETTGYADVIGVVPGTPGDKAGIVRGDQILKIDGQSFRGKQLRDVVYAIRGKSGTDLTLTILHEDRIVARKLKRETLVWDSVDSKVLDGGTGLVTIRYFTDATPQLLKKQLEHLKNQEIKKLVIDLRGNEGGVFERSIESINLLLPKDKLIVHAVKRGRNMEKIMSTSGAILSGIPMAVLINEETKSGAEIMAAALKISGGAVTVGATTFGKWSAQRVEELANKFAIKYTTATFVAPNGLDLSGKGLAVDIPVELAADVVTKLQNQPDMGLRLRDDVQLQAAMHVLSLRG